MEHVPQSTEMSPAQLEEKIAGLEQEIISLEEKITRVHQESGSNSSDDNSQEEAMDLQSRDIIAGQITDKRAEMVRLQDLLLSLNQKAA